jgi:1-acyl-sn-glycerol-3-phosphate acyltransferase
MSADRPPQPEETILSIAAALHRELNPDRPPWQCDLDASLDRDWGFDSLARAELFLRIERAFGVSLPERLLTEAQTLRELEAVLATASGETPPAREPVALVAPSHGEAAPARLETLTEVLDWHSEHHGDQCHAVILQREGEDVRLSYRDLSEGSRRVAAGLIREGVVPGDRVGIMLPTGRAFLLAFFGCLYAGAMPTPIYPPGRPGQLAQHLRRQAGILRNSGAGILIIDETARAVGRLLQFQVGSRIRLHDAESLARGGEATLPRIEPGQGALVQYTSGSTGDPKGVVLTHANLLANIRAMGEVIAPGRDDVFVSWLPLYHDMGLIGAWLGSLHYGVPLILMSPLQFLVRPEQWLWTIHHYGGTLTAAPNFAYELCMKAADSDRLAGLNLGSMRMAANGAEPVSPQTVRRFVECMRPYGFRPEAMAPVYGLAENGVGLAFPRPGTLPFIDRIDRVALEREGRAVPVAPDADSALEFVSCGEPLPRHEIRIVGASGELGDREEGLLEFRGPSATSGYLNSPEKNRELFDGSWLSSGDLAYIADGRVFVTGRTKDIVIRAGQHIYPQEVEEVVGAIPGIRKGCVAAFGSADPQAGTERLIVLAETREKEPDRLDQLRRTVADAVGDLLDAPPEEVVLVPPHSVPKTSSGKIRRASARRLFEEDRLKDRPAAVRWQLLLLALDGLRAQARRLGRSAIALLYGGYWWLVIFAAGLIAWPLVVLLPVRSWRWGALSGLSRLAVLLLGLRLRTMFEAPVPDASILVANHSSYLDNLILAAVLPHPLRFVAKRELASQLVAGPFLRALGTVFVERDLSGALASERALMELGGNREKIVIYPEGTFTRAPGLRPFHLGAFKLATEAGLPVVPVAIRGTRSLLRGLSGLPRRGPVEVRVGPALQGAGPGFADAVHLRDRARAFIGAHCGEPDPSGPQA